MKFPIFIESHNPDVQSPPTRYMSKTYEISKKVVVIHINPSDFGEGYPGGCDNFYCLDPGLATLLVQRVVTCRRFFHPKMRGLLNTFWEAESGVIFIDVPFFGQCSNCVKRVKHRETPPKTVVLMDMSKTLSMRGSVCQMGDVKLPLIRWEDGAQVYIGTHPFIIYPEADFSCSFPHSLPLGPKVPFVTVI